MRHLSAVKSFSRHSSHRTAMMRNMVMNIIEHGRIRTTVQKAKAARPIAEKLITLAKKGTPHHRRLALKELGSTVAAKRTILKLFGEVKTRFEARTGGYTRIIRLPTTIRQAKADLPRGQKFNRSKYYGTRLGDNSTLVLWELCEAEVTPREKSQKQRRSKKAKKKAAAPVAAAKEAPAAEQAPAAAAPETPAVPPAAEAPKAEGEQK
ncbi:MAG TPA: 50S ribosomal protein L17 [Planctomycetota bacterium]|jgi:large subunit ribosomal protein L17